MKNIKTLHENPNNPRSIDPDKLEKLKKSISEFPKMMELRPIIADESDMIIGGNMRFKALCELGYTEIPDMPSSVNVSIMKVSNARLHHKIRWNNTVPKIISEDLKK